MMGFECSSKTPESRPCQKPTNVPPSFCLLLSASLLGHCAASAAATQRCFACLFKLSVISWWFLNSCLSVLWKARCLYKRGLSSYCGEMVSKWAILTLCIERGLPGSSRLLLLVQFSAAVSITSAAASPGMALISGVSLMVLQQFLI